MALQSRAPAPTILLTRPARQSARFAAALRARLGEVAVEISPLLMPDFLAPDLPGHQPDALVFTSEAGVEGARRLSAHPGLPAWCVGTRTAEAARAAGYLPRVAGGDAAALLAAITAEGPAGRLLYLRGQEVRLDLVDCLRRAGFQADEAVVYRQMAQSLTLDALNRLRGPGPVIVPLFSARTAELFAAAAVEPQAPLWVAALSPAVTAALPFAPDRLETARVPDAEAMVEAVAALIAASPTLETEPGPQ